MTSRTTRRSYIYFLGGTAFAATYTFLAINGARLTADAHETQEFVLTLYEGDQFTFDKLVPWLRDQVAYDAPQK